MKKIVTLFFMITFFTFYSQHKISYLKNNRFDLNSTKYYFPETGFNIIGFGAYHGSAKTEDAEIQLIKTLTKDKLIKKYLPETDFSIAYFFNKYLKTGDTILLKNLVIHYGIRVPQERTIEVYDKWKKLKEINDLLLDKDKIEVIGIDFQVSYKYTAKHILELVNNSNNRFFSVKEIEKMVKSDTVNYALSKESYANKILRNFVIDYEKNKQKYKSHVYDLPSLNHIVKNLKLTFGKRPKREKIIYDNYLTLDSIYDFKNNPQFLRMGFFHIEKSMERKNGYPSFFTRLIENKVYPKKKVLSVIGYLTESKVFWDELYDDKGNYTGFTIEGGYGIGDYEKEYFRGIQNLKATKISDKTIYRLNKNNSPYAINEPDLIEIIMIDEKSNGEDVKGMSTLDFLDYAILISNSKESTPIYEMK
jgi:hypothetical protein